MLSNLLLAKITILLCFFFCVVFNNFLTTPIVKENANLKLEFPIPTVVPITVANEVTEMPQIK